MKFFKNKIKAITLIELITTIAISWVLFLIIFVFITDSVEELVDNDVKISSIDEWFNFKDTMWRFVRWWYSEAKVFDIQSSVNIASWATITYTPTAYSPWPHPQSIINWVISTVWTDDYEYHSASWNAFINFNWPEDKKIWQVKIYNRVWCCSDRLSWATVTLYDSLGSILYTYTLDDTTWKDVILIDFSLLWQIHPARSLRLQTVWWNVLNIREIEIFSHKDNYNQVLYLKKLDLSEWILIWIVNLNSKKLLKDYTYWDNFLWYRYLSLAEMASIDADNSIIYDVEFGRDKIFQNLRMKDFRVWVYNYWYIIDVYFSVINLFDDSLFWKNFADFYIDKLVIDEYNLIY